ncbi:hypothetical protein [Saccharophagus degradans]|uniref:Uncharacterized protein n=1 Tax=Saccharophagus degradans TaxID=86304 RepID=A0AAW7XE16_9GAMM|nr:hypothetical protein [Saccharophagus degradans]MDO6424783.1 hypothetical protein [Saccharophagus degradans]MDO6609667.1 hypothetical protein [Saccharophagus degradans]
MVVALTDNSAGAISCWHAKASPPEELLDEELELDELELEEELDDELEELFEELFEELVEELLDELLLDELEDEPLAAPPSLPPPQAASPAKQHKSSAHFKKVSFRILPNAVRVKSIRNINYSRIFFILVIFSHSFTALLSEHTATYNGPACKRQ